FEKNGEKSIEIDPRVTSNEQLEFLAKRGFNRVSLGVQDFDCDVQVAIGREQPIEVVQEKVDVCRSLGFRGINFDLIYGLPLQTPKSFAETLEKAIEMRPDRLAVYSFAYLPKMRANQSKINADELPPAEKKYQLFSLAVEHFTGAGYRQIGMDHFALPEDELSIAQNDGRLFRNFMGYTVQSSDEMIGFGMSSIGYISNSFFQNISTLNRYQKSVNEHDWAIFRGKKLNEDDLIRQYLITSLMCNFKLEFVKLKEKFGVEYSEYFKDEDTRLDEFINDGFLKRIEYGLEITPLGRTFVRNIAMTYDTYLAKPDSKGTMFSRTI
ncbi:MAG: oxygen-independent coproporphyrinogen III oxidase, partial [Candidatus Zixiibacteriota bacterium]